MQRRERLLKAVLDAGPAGIAPRDAIPKVYPEADGGPITAPDCIYVMASYLKGRNLIRVEGKTHTARYYPPQAA